MTIDLDALEAEIREQRWEDDLNIELDLFIKAGDILAVIEELKSARHGEAFAQNRANAYAITIARLERVREAAARVIDPSEKLLTHKRRDWAALFELEQALAAAQSGQMKKAPAE